MIRYNTCIYIDAKHKSLSLDHKYYMSSHYNVYIIHSIEVPFFNIFPGHIVAFVQSRREPKYTLMIYILFSHLKPLPDEPFSLFNYCGIRELQNLDSVAKTNETALQKSQ
jgi:hypothetical protein